MQLLTIYTFTFLKNTGIINYNVKMKNSSDMFKQKRQSVVCSEKRKYEKIN